MIKVQIWRDDECQRVLATAFGPVLIQRGETCILVVGKDLDPRAIEALKLLQEPPNPFSEDK